MSDDILILPEKLLCRVFGVRRHTHATDDARTHVEAVHVSLSLLSWISDHRTHIHDVAIAIGK